MCITKYIPKCLQLSWRTIGLRTVQKYEKLYFYNVVIISVEKVNISKVDQTYYISYTIPKIQSVNG